MLKTDGNARLHIISLCLLILVCAGIFSNSLGNSFIWDDQEAIVEDRYLQNVRYIPSLFSPEYWRNVSCRTRGIYRPIVAASFAVDFAVWKNDPFGYHLTNLFLHTICTVLFYLFVYLLTSKRKELRIVPLLSALFFASHPVHVEAVSWVKNRSDLLSGIFFLATIICFAVFSNRKKPRAQWTCYALSLVSYICALTSKQSAFALPLVLLLYVLCFMPRDRYRSCLATTLPFFIVSAGFVYFKIAALGLLMPQKTGSAAVVGLYENILAVPVTLGYYLRLLVFPANLTAEHLFSPPDSILAPAFLLSVSILVILLSAGVVAFKKNRVVFFALFWVFLTLLPVSNILFLYGRPIAEQRLYLPSMGFCLLFGLGIMRLYSWERLYLSSKTAKFSAAGVFLLILALYCASTFDRNRDWKDPRTFWEEIIKRSPLSARAYNNLGIVLTRSGDPEQAIPLFERSIEIDSSYENPHNNLGVLYGASGNIDASVDHFKKALLINPSNMNSYINLANAYYISGRTEEAIQLYKKSMSLNPYRAKAYDNLSIIYDKLGRREDALDLHKTQLMVTPYSSEIHTNLGRTYMVLGKYTEAAAAFREALQNDPSNAAACGDLGILAGLMDNNLESVALFKRALRLDPENAKTYVNLGISYQKMGDLDNAIYSYKQAIELDPGYPDAYNNLGVVYGMLTRHEEALGLFLKVVKLDPENANAYVNIARLYNVGGNISRALSAMKKASDLDPANKPVYTALLNQYHDIVSKYEDEVRSAPENTEALFALGTIYHESGEYDKALEKYIGVLKVDPGHARACYAISIIYFNRGLYEKAVEYYDQAEKFGVSDPAYLKVLAPHKKTK